MKRSRRSLGILLAMMSFALLVVRATTLPARPIATSSRNQLQSLGTLDSRLSIRERTLRGAGVSPAPTVQVGRLHHNTARNTVPPRRAVSVSAVIVVLPRAAIVSQAQSRMGWSGCSAYAHGCDHLGRALSLTARRRTSLAERLIVAALERVFTPLSRASMKSSVVLLEIATPLNQPEALASGWNDLRCEL